MKAKVNQMVSFFRNFKRQIQSQEPEKEIDLRPPPNKTELTVECGFSSFESHGTAHYDLRGYFGQNNKKSGEGMEGLANLR